MPAEPADPRPAPLKAPVWTWEVPLYFFVGGAAGCAALLAAVAATTGADPSLARHARWIAGVGAAVSPVLLISDLGRPDRFVNMLRIVKLQSPMSVGAWTLVVFSVAVFVAIVLDAVGPAAGAAATLRTGADAVAAATGLLLATYTGVLIGVTAVPIWAKYATLLPIHFGASALGAAVSLVELAGHRTAAMNLVGLGAAAIETGVLMMLESRRDEVTRPLFAGRMGTLTRVGSALTGPVALMLRLVGATSTPLRFVAALCTISGSLLTRFGWIAAGRLSAAAPPVDR